MTLQEMLSILINERHLPNNREKLIRYLNDAMIDLVSELQPRRSDNLTLVNGRLDTNLLPKTVVKVIALERNGTRLPFYYGCDDHVVRVPATDDGAVLVTYRYLPNPLKDDNDEPDVPEWSHNAMMNYATGREYAAGDTEHVMAARSYFESYNSAKRIMRDMYRSFECTSKH